MTAAAVRLDARGKVRSRPIPDDLTYENPLGRIAMAMEPTSEADPVGVLGSLVSSASVHVGAGVRIRLGDSTYPVLVWTILCGGTSSGRKGTAAGVAARVFDEADPTFSKDRVLSGVSSGEGLIHAVRDPDDDDDDEGKNELDDKRILVVESEFATVLTRARREGNPLAAILRQAWDGSDLAVMTKAKLKASRPHIGIVGHISPAEFRAKTSASDLAGGSYNRFLLLHVERSKRLPWGGGARSSLVEELGRDLRRRLLDARDVGIVDLAQDSVTRRCWESLYYEFTDLEDDEDISQWVARAGPYTMRLAALYAGLDGRWAIGDADLLSAAALVRYSLESIRFVFDAGSAAGGIEAIAEFVGRAGPEGVLRSAITKAFASRMNAAEVGNYLDQLEGLGALESVRVQPEGGGRPGKVYRQRVPS